MIGMILINDGVDVLIIGLEILEEFNEIIEIDEQFLIKINLNVFILFNHVFKVANNKSNCYLIWLSTWNHNICIVYCRLNELIEATFHEKIILIQNALYIPSSIN